jgi:hypothetical protein
MRRAAIGLFILPLGLLYGCGRSSSPSTLPSPHHGGNLVELSESRGFVELRTERGLRSKAGNKGQNLARIVAYFYQPDATTVISPAPIDVKITLGAAGTGTVVNLTPESKEPGPFASEPGIYPDELRGQIDFQLEGKPVQAMFSFR